MATIEKWRFIWNAWINKLLEIMFGIKNTDKQMNRDENITFGLV